MRNYMLTFILLLAMQKVFGQFGDAPPNTTWTPYVKNYDEVRWTDWSNAGRQGGLPENFSYFVNVSDSKYTGSFTANLIAAINDAHTFAIDHNVIVAVKIPAGSYNVDQTINLPSNTVIKGAGSNTTFLSFQMGNNSQHCFSVSGSIANEPYKNVQSGQTMGST